METVFSQSHVPMAVKFLFDYFDQLASASGINDSDVCHIWKSNTYVNFNFISTCNFNYKTKKFCDK